MQNTRKMINRLAVVGIFVTVPMVTQATTYSLKITNHSGAAQNVAVYQDYPESDGYSTIWYSKNINDGNFNEFEWSIDWQLNWGTTPQPLIAGVKWSSGGGSSGCLPGYIWWHKPDNCRLFW